MQDLADADLRANGGFLASRARKATDTDQPFGLQYLQYTMQMLIAGLGDGDTF